MNQRPPHARLTAIGLMSGTSMDGIDAAVLVTDGDGEIEPGPSLSRAYAPELRGALLTALSEIAAADDPVRFRAKLSDLETRLTRANAEAVLALMDSGGLVPSAVDVVGYHGQTVLHRPQRRITVQLGDGALLARLTGVPVVNDFRTADVAAGGEGAPFAPAYHRALARASGETPLVVVNIGGVANVTWLDGAADPVAFDTGPGNALLDDFVAARTGRLYDEGGALALAGTVDEAALAALMANAYFDRPPPKSLDRNEFSARAVAHLMLEDGAATLAAFTARTIAGSARFIPTPPRRWVVSGGGRRNAAILRHLADLVGAEVATAEDAGWRGDDIEAEAFAYLAVRSLKGWPLSWPTTTGVPRPMPGGVSHWPGDRHPERVTAS
jgi:anhydro-N-acetylmuramic acid kinase